MASRQSPACTGASTNVRVRLKAPAAPQRIEPNPSAPHGMSPATFRFPTLTCPCLARHAETCARVPERRRRKLRTPGRGICRLGRRLRISARHPVSLVGDGSRLAAARVSPLPASRRGASASLCALQAGVSGPVVMLRTWRASATLEAVRSSAAHGRAVSSRRHRVRDARPPNRRGPPVGRPSISRAPLRAVDPARRPLPRIPSSR